MVDRIEAHFRTHGFGLYAMQLHQGQEFIGFAGLSVPAFQARFTPCVEIGWRLAAEHWGRGLATEAARAVLGQAFDSLGLDSLVSFTVPANVRSRRVMEKIGMTHDPDDDFNHPRQPEGIRCGAMCSTACGARPLVAVPSRRRSSPWIFRTLRVNLTPSNRLAMLINYTGPILPSVQCGSL
jgi:RimJ/RimL family protein N-acetyltransferase